MGRPCASGDRAQDDACDREFSERSIVVPRRDAVAVVSSIVMTRWKRRTCDVRITPRSGHL